MATTRRARYTKNKEGKLADAKLPGTQVTRCRMDIVTGKLVCNELNFRERPEAETREAVEALAAAHAEKDDNAGKL
jgi:hypothetical protein